ncbi:unnamed protein product [Rotaria sordida]|uniref:Uncharacterized protein n=1 Tax=Rotaria sordida TaxID=392033 RepID=A0A815J955_9BILA|nr:unnamed protein product [Rotaria sordida]
MRGLSMTSPQDIPSFAAYFPAWKFFVTNFLQQIRSVHGVEKIVEDTMKIPTSYGERLVWLLPGKNRLILHMKHKNR